MKTKKIYLAIPYIKFGMELSFQISNKVAADLLKQGHFVFAPISQCHEMSKAHDLPKDFPFWERLDKCFIDWADEVHVINVGEKHLKESRGVQEEIRYAEENGKPVVFINWTRDDSKALLSLRIDSMSKEIKQFFELVKKEI